MSTLSDLREGESGTIVKVRGRGAFRKRITEMGFIRGKEVTVVKAAPLQDPIEYKLMGYNVSLRKSEAALVEVISSLDFDYNHAAEELAAGNIVGGQDRPDTRVLLRPGDVDLLDDCMGEPAPHHFPVDHVLPLKVCGKDGRSTGLVKGVVIRDGLTDPGGHLLLLP